MEENILYLSLIAINLIAFVVYGADKHKARRNRWRTPESVLLLLAALGGSPGALLGMHLFHHKTQKLKFRILVPAMLIIQVVVLLFILMSL